MNQTYFLLYILVNSTEKTENGVLWSNKVDINPFILQEAGLEVNIIFKILFRVCSSILGGELQQQQASLNLGLEGSRIGFLKVLEVRGSVLSGSFHV